MFEKKAVHALLAAPTGRAARRMEDATGRPAQTIHRLLEFSPQAGRFTRREDHPLETDMVVVDETSMVDLELMQALLAAVPDEARLLLVGDVDQLPSVGAGNVLFDLIASNALPVVRLEQVFRQGRRSGIAINAQRINQGEYPQYNETDFFFIEREDPVRARETIVELVTARIPNKFELDPVRDIQVLAPMHRGECGVAKLNEVLRETLNPHGQVVPRSPFRLGDKVMQTRNNYELDAANGDMGVISKVEEEAGEIEIAFDDRTLIYPLDSLGDLTFAYAATVHKSQGSEYPAVVLPVLPQFYMMLQRNLLYTAITRASRILIMVGQHKAAAMAVRNTGAAQRYTRLSERIREVAGTTR